MLNLVENMTTIYFRLPDEVGITHAQLIKLLELSDSPYSNEANAKIKAVNDELNDITENIGNVEAFSDEYKYLIELAYQKHEKLKELERLLRPFGRGVQFSLVDRKDKWFGWFSYCKTEILSKEEINYIKNYIIQTLNCDAVTIEVDIYTISDELRAFL